jgi:hypothetical protein
MDAKRPTTLVDFVYGKMFVTPTGDNENVFGRLNRIVEYT